jgi:hypothetical protein
MSALPYRPPVSGRSGFGQTAPKDKRPLVAVVARKRTGGTPPQAIILRAPDSARTKSVFRWFRPLRYIKPEPGIAARSRFHGKVFVACGSTRDRLSSCPGQRSAAGPLRFRQSGAAAGRETTKLMTLKSLVGTPAKEIEPVMPVPAL